MKLTELKKGEAAIISKIENIGELKRRLHDFGINSGEVIKFKRNAPLGDPQQYCVKGNNVAIRKEDAQNIIVELSENFSCHKNHSCNGTHGEGKGFGRKFRNKI